MFSQRELHARKNAEVSQTAMPADLSA